MIASSFQYTNVHVRGIVHYVLGISGRREYSGKAQVCWQASWTSSTVATSYHAYGLLFLQCNESAALRFEMRKTVKPPIRSVNLPAAGYQANPKIQNLAYKVAKFKSGLPR